MAQQTTEDAVRRTVTVQAPTDQAFAVFTRGLSTWWPPEYTWARDTLDTIGIEPREGGRCFERGPHGFWSDWGRVLVWDPPHRLVFSWQISPRREPEPDPEKASEVEIRFVAEGPQDTRVELEHRGFERHGEDRADYRAALGSAEGWTYILDRYASGVARYEVRIVEAWHEALNDSDVGRLVALSHPDVEVGGPRGAGRGVQILREWVGRAGIRLEPRRIFHGADTVVVEQEAEWRSADTGEVTGSQTVSSVFVIRDERISRVVRYPDLADALSAVNLDKSHETGVD